ncbi:MAG: class I SAM-dependent methyltransferase [Anaerolineaceae bacterium]|nr:class I SAM-dependent methyltransferase [Anaerolineaceae bacterium]
MKNQPNLKQEPYTCPPWLLFTFDNPVRNALQNPKKMLAGLVKSGDVVLDVGCGMGYLSLPMAEMVGEHGKVIGADLSEVMLAGLGKRAEKAGVMERVEPHLCSAERIGIAEAIDFAVAFWMVHEVRNQEAFLQEIYDALKTGGQFLLVEPHIHVTGKGFERTVALAKDFGFKEIARPKVFFSRAVVLGK